jgi:predicted nucleic acid-binding protein
MRVVIDTNILVSAFWSRNGAPARVLFPKNDLVRSVIDFLGSLPD